VRRCRAKEVSRKDAKIAKSWTVYGAMTHCYTLKPEPQKAQKAQKRRKGEGQKHETVHSVRSDRSWHTDFSLRIHAGCVFRLRNSRNHTDHRRWDGYIRFSAVAKECDFQMTTHSIHERRK
jgi:hypothetical protein